MKKISLILICSILFLLAAPSFAILAEEEVQDLIFYESFEKRFSELPKGWSYFGNSTGVVKMDTENASHGRISVRLIDDSDKTTLGIMPKAFPVKPGLRYTVLTDVYAYSGNCNIYLRFFDKDGKTVSDRTLYHTIIGEWDTVEISDFAPDLAVSATLILYISAINKGNVLFDNVRVLTNDAGFVLSNPPVQNEAVPAKLVAPVENKLVYTPYNEYGDQLTDFTYAGFQAGRVDLPRTEHLKLAATIEPSQDPKADDTKRIQEVIDEVSNKVSKGEMQVIRLEAGRYNINSAGLQIKSGVVLSGSGQGPNGTVLFASEPKQYTVLSVYGTPARRISVKADILDDYVKAGSNEIHVAPETIKNFKVGDLITVYHPSTEKWVAGVEMEKMTDIFGNDSSWKKGDVDMYTERTISSIQGNKITLDFPLYVPLNREYSQSYIYVTDDSGKIENFGFENLRVESTYNGNAADEAHSNYAIAIYYGKNGFVRDVSTKHFVANSVRCARGAKQITVQNCSSLQPVSQIVGSRRYAFACAYDAQQILMTGCYSYDGRHDYTASYNGTGPLAFVDNVADTSNQSSETHGVWTTGLLYDNVYQTKPGGIGFMAFPNAGVLGTGNSHGWTASGCVAWNCLTTTFIAHKPSLSYQNFMIGVFARFLDSSSLGVKKINIRDHMFGGYRTSKVPVGNDVLYYTREDTPFVGDAYRESETAPVEPRSLFKAQLAQRITGNIKNERPNAPIILSPKSDFIEVAGRIQVNGIYQKGADKVTLYIDDLPYEATLNKENGTFTFSIDLQKGWHKIYATQTINGQEGTKNADRFVRIGEEEDLSNPDHLKSYYPREKTALIRNDTRPTYDQVKHTDYAGNDNLPIKVIIDGNTVEFDVEPILNNNRVLVPIRGVFEALEVQVTYDESTQRATAKNEEDTVVLTANSDTALVNETEIKLDTPVMIIGGRMMVPARFVAESFGVNSVEWIDPLKIVYIDANKIIYEPMHNIPNALHIYGITQSGDDGAGNSIQNTLDGKLGTRWAVAETEEQAAFGIFDLKSIKSLSEVYIAFMNGNTRVYTFSIEVSTDGKNFVRVLDQQKTSGKTNELEAYPLNEASARYVKLVGHGNNQNAWNSITEILFTEVK